MNPWRQVVKGKRTYSGGRAGSSGQVLLPLECGHLVWRSCGADEPKRVRCKDCGELARKASTP